MSKFKHLLLILLTALASGANAAETSKGTTLWDNWYVITDHGHPDSYYNEKASIQGDRAKIQVNTWILDGQKIRAENLGAYAKNTPLLEPLLYNFRSEANGQEKIIDGTILENGKVFSVKTKIADKPSTSLRAQMIPKLILASFFPLWIHQNYKRISGVQPIEFQAIVEDKVEGEVPVVGGSAYEMKQDEFAQKSGTRKLRIEFNKLVAFWWVTKNGDAVKIEVPALERVVKKTDQKTAESFLKP